jgi:hypothetical protein
MEMILTHQSLAQAIGLLREFSGSSLTATLAGIEGPIAGINSASCGTFLEKTRAAKPVLAAAAEMKRQAGQINVVIHALGILRCLPHILEDGEKVEYTSLGAGNTGREFDLETNYRIAEFKFIQWRGGPESIRQNGVFKDFFLLASSQSKKRKYLYVLGTEFPLKFLNGGRAMRSVLKDKRMQELFSERHGSEFERIRDYYHAHRDLVHIEDVTAWLPELAGQMLPDVDEGEL